MNFTIEPCAALPTDLSVLIPVDTIAPAPGFVGDADVFPGETPVSEVRGARDEGPGNPLPPRAGNSAPQARKPRTPFLLLLLAGAAATSSRSRPGRQLPSEEAISASATSLAWSGGRPRCALARAPGLTLSPPERCFYKPKLDLNPSLRP